MDIAGPFIGKMFSTLVDAHSKWLEAHILPSTTSSSIVASSIVGGLRKIFATFGLPRLLVSDNGPNFVSAEIKDFLKRNGVWHRASALYHPAINGLAE